MSEEFGRRFQAAHATLRYLVHEMDLLVVDHADVMIAALHAVPDGRRAVRAAALIWARLERGDTVLGLLERLERV